MQVSLRDFFNYKPIFEQKDIDNFFQKEVKDKVIDYLWEQAWEKVQKAYDYAKSLHWDDKRLSWEPYIVHPVYVTKYLLMIRPWVIALQAALLHDVVEDTEATWDDILEEFWPEVAFLCLWLEKVSKVKYQWEDRQIETLKKTFLAMGRDIRVILIKLADRIHNIQTLKYHPKVEKQQRIAQETMKIFSPLAKRLWIEVFQTYLENWAFAILNPTDFDKIFKYLNDCYSRVDITSLINKIDLILKNSDVDYTYISWRLKTPYRIFLKFWKYWTEDINEIKDILAFRIIVNDIPQCYRTLWVFHAEYAPIITKIKDYIALPKHNGYQSLHTTILWLYRTPVEIQIRTEYMHHFAEYWVAAHFLYKESKWWNSANKKQLEWINKLKELVEQYSEWQENKWFFDVLNIDFLRKSVFVYTPTWTVIELPKWSTVLDFAFTIHTDIWLKFKSAFVNWKIAPIDHRLRNWDIIEIKKFQNKIALRKSWLDYVISPTSKNKIRHFLNKQERDKQVEIWKGILNEKLRENKLPEIYSKEDKISSKFSDKELNLILLQVYNKNTSPIRLLKEVYNISPKAKEEKPQTPPKPVKQDQVLIEDSSLFQTFFCPECNAKIWDTIIWKVTKEWVKVHNVNCKALKSVNFDKLVEAHRSWELKRNYEVVFSFDLWDTVENVISILNIIQWFSMTILNINTFKDKNKTDRLNVIVWVSNPTALAFAKDTLKRQKNIFKSFKILFN